MKKNQKNNVKKGYRPKLILAFMVQLQIKINQQIHCYVENKLLKTKQKSQIIEIEIILSCYEMILQKR